MIDYDQRTVYGIMAVGMAIYLSFTLWTGELGLVRAPQAWRETSRRTDPGRYWAFVVGIAVVTLGFAFSAITGVG